jgi:pimeloyl-ACP methyl ester carboxylesterase
MKASLAAWVVGAGLLAFAPAVRGAEAPVERGDHAVTVSSTAPGFMGQKASVYVREVKARTSGAGGGGRKGVVLFVHGAGTPAEVAFDSPYKDYSWMAFLARGGFDVYAMDMEGYGRSTRPPAMDDPCNLPPASQKTIAPDKAPCPASYDRPITTMGSDWNDISAVVDWVLARTGAKTLDLVGWSQGGPRTVGYTLRHPEKVSRLAVLAPAYIAGMPTEAPSPLPGGPPLTSQTQAEFKANWDKQEPCPGQYEPAMLAATWSEMLASDPVGAKWGPGVRRAPKVPSWGFNTETVKGLKTPFLMVSGEHDGQVAPERVRALYADVGSPDKVFIDLACSSHNAMWEKNHLLLFQATLDWLTSGKVDGRSEGVIRKGY